MKQRTIYVDDTLLRAMGSTRVPRPGVADALRRLHAEGANLHLWRSGGADYAQSSSRELGLESCFAGFLTQPDAYIDEHLVNEWRCCQPALPGNASMLNET